MRRPYLRREALTKHCEGVLKMFESGMTMKEIARLLDNSEHNVKYWLKKAREHTCEVQQ